MAKHNPNFVTLTTDDPPSRVRARLGEDRPEISAGYGGWEEIERPKRSTVTSWKGQPARRMSLSLLLDNFRVGTSIEDDIRALERMGLPRPGPSAPPVVNIEAVGGVVPWKRRDWVIDGIEWGDAIMNRNGNRVRQAAVVTFIEFVSDELIRKSPAQKRRDKKGKKGRSKRYVVKRGDHLRSIAAKQLGSAKKWKAIADLNNIRDPRKLKVGQKLRLP